MVGFSFFFIIGLFHFDYLFATFSQKMLSSLPKKTLLTPRERAFHFDRVCKAEYRHLHRPLDLDVLQDKSILLIPGLFHEVNGLLHSRVLNHQKQILQQDLGIPFFIEGFASQGCLVENADLLYEKICSQATFQGKKLILLGHSKGGVEALYAILKYPQLVTEGIVDRVVLIQSPVQGSRFLEQNQNTFLVQLGKKLISKPLNALMPDQSQLFLKNLLENLDSLSLDSLQRFLSERVYYLRGFKDQAQISSVLKKFISYFEKHFDEEHLNDGILGVDEQHFLGFGKDLSVMQEDHLFLCASSAEEINRVRVFYRVLMRLLYSL
jgi:hypothetical protein